MSVKVTILGDTRFQNHFGCDMVMSVLFNELKRIDFQIIKIVHVSKRNYTIPVETDLIIINGEGTIHHGAGQHLLSVVDNYPEIPAVLINAVWQDNPVYHNLDKLKYVSVRESLSYNQLPECITNKEVIPDLIYLSSITNHKSNHDHIEDIGITDNVLNNCRFDISSRASPEVVVKKFNKYKRICTGRHHGVALAAILGKPFSAWPSNTHKILGMMIDMNIPQHHYTNQNDAIENVPHVLDKNVTTYIESAKIKITNMFDKLKSGILLT